MGDLGSPFKVEVLGFMRDIPQHTTEQMNSVS